MDTNQSGGQRPRIDRACRAFLREVFGGGENNTAEGGAHLAACAACAARVAARDRLAAALRQRPELPANVSPTHRHDPLLEGVYERIAEQVAASGLGQLLAVPAAGHADEAAWPAGLLASDVARRAVEQPPAAPAFAWLRMRESILGEVAHRAARRLRFRWALGAAAASVLVAGGLLLSRGEQPAAPNIVFRDLASMPGVDFAAVRYGALR